MECILCKQDTDKREVIKEKPQEEVEVSKENHEKCGLIKEVICKNMISKKKGFKWYRQICDNHILKVRRSKNERRSF